MPPPPFNSSDLAFLDQALEGNTFRSGTEGNDALALGEAQRQSAVDAQVAEATPMFLQRLAQESTLQMPISNFTAALGAGIGGILNPGGAALGLLGGASQQNFLGMGRKKGGAVAGGHRRRRGLTIKTKNDIIWLKQNVGPGAATAYLNRKSV